MSQYQTAVKRGLDSYDEEDGEREGLLPLSSSQSAERKDRRTRSEGGTVDASPELASGLAALRVAMVLLLAAGAVVLLVCHERLEE